MTYSICDKTRRDALDMCSSFVGQGWEREQKKPEFYLELVDARDII